MSNAKTPRPWPNQARWARDESAELADSVARLLDKLVDNWFDVDEVAKMQVIHKCSVKARQIRDKLDAVAVKAIGQE